MLVELQMLKIYVKTSLISHFIIFSKFFTNIQILFIWKKDINSYLYIYY